MSYLQVAILFLVTSLQTCEGVLPSDCITANYFYYNENHTACLPKSSNSSQSGVSVTDQRAIVEKHNIIRSVINARNMQKMVWDDEIAAVAQRWADNCQFRRDSIRRIPGKYDLGQNIELGAASWADAVDNWLKEKKDYSLGMHYNQLSKIQNYIQMIWATSGKIGCGYSFCSNLEGQNFYVCNYAHRRLENEDWLMVYDHGPRCEHCPGKCSADELCDCGGKVCRNGGVLELSSCRCCCTKKWYVSKYDCGLNCSDVQEIDLCKSSSHLCQGLSDVAERCPKVCNICPYSLTIDTLTIDTLKNEIQSGATTLAARITFTFCLPALFLIM